MNITARHERDVYTPPSMKGAIVTSGIFHLLLFVLTAVGIPFIARDPLIISTPINIELIKIDKVTQTDKVAQPKKLDKPKPIEKKPVPPKVTAEAPPDLTKPKPVEVEEVVVKPKPAPKKPKSKPKPPKKQESDFASLLKNLTPDTDAGEVEEIVIDPQETQIAKLSDQLTMSERTCIIKY